MSNKIENPIKNVSLFRFENFFNIYEDKENKINFYNILKNIRIEPIEDAELHDIYTVRPSDTWISIAYKNYNNMNLWWIVCEYNQIENPTIMPEAGTKLKILKSSYVYSVITELKNQFNR